METTIKSHKDLLVWQKSLDLVENVYLLTEKFPQRELYGLSAQMRRAAVSISSNIAESYHRFHSKEKRQFLAIAFGSGSELESQIEVAKVLFPHVNYNYKKIEDLLLDVMKILNNFLGAENSK